jgi:hypothetical protein
MRFLETAEAPAQGNLLLPVVNEVQSPPESAGTKKQEPAKRRPKAEAQAKAEGVEAKAREDVRQKAKSGRSRTSQHETKNPALGRVFRAPRREAPKSCHSPLLAQRLDAGDSALLWRAALLRWITFLLTSESTSGCASLRAAMASALLPAASASLTLRRAERMRERSATLRVRLVSARRAAFSADFVLPRRNSEDPGRLKGA